VDGKTEWGAKAVHIVSTWTDETGLVPGWVRTEEKSNEITAISAPLDISGSIVTIDAMGRQRAITADIEAEHGGHTPAKYIKKLKNRLKV
jgi:hypothetical protein